MPSGPSDGASAWKILVARLVEGLGDMRNSIVSRLLLAFALSLCAAAPLFLTGCGDDDGNDGPDTAVQGDMAKPDLSNKDI
jgi:hypothetical protein